MRAIINRTVCKRIVSQSSIRGLFGEGNRFNIEYCTYKNTSWLEKHFDPFLMFCFILFTAYQIFFKGFIILYKYNSNKYMDVR